MIVKYGVGKLLEVFTKKNIKKLAVRLGMEVKKNGETATEDRKKNTVDKPEKSK